MSFLVLAAASLVPLVAVELAKAARWRVLLGRRRPSYAQCLRALVAGQLTNSLLPVRAGEAVSLGVLRAEGGGLVAGAAGLAGIKAIDSLVLAAIAGAVIGTAAAGRAGWSGATGAAALALAAAVVLQRERFRRLLEGLPWARQLRLAALADVVDALHDRRTLVVALLTTLVAWGAGLVANAAILAAVGITPDLNLAARVIVAGYLVNVLPSPPAGLGVFEAGIAVALTTAGVPLPLAILAGVTLHVCQFVKLGLLLAASVVWSRWLRPVQLRPA